MKKFKLSDRELCLIILLIFFGFISIFSLYQLKKEKGIDETVHSFNSKIASKYTKVVQSEEEDILNFLHPNISEEFVVIPAMDYIFSKCFSRFSNEGKSSLYYYYYDSTIRFRILYQDLIDVTEYTYALKSFLESYGDEEVDINDYEVYSRIDLPSLRTLMTELRQSHFKLYNDGDYFQVYFDYDWFLEEYKDILSEEFINFIKLDALSSSPLLVHEREAVDVVSVEDLVFSSKDYLDTYGDKNQGLSYGALNLFRSSLLFFTGGRADAHHLYDNTDEYIISADVYDYYYEVIDRYPDSTLAPLLEEVINIMKERSGKGSPVTIYVEEVVDKYLLENGYATDETLASLKGVTGNHPYTITTEGLQTVEDTENIEYNH